jgi:hypothetical protein
MNYQLSSFSALILLWLLLILMLFIFFKKNDLESIFLGVAHSIAHEKPVFLKPIIKELKRLECGDVYKINSIESKLLYFFVLIGIFDRPARAAILNMLNSTEYYGCLKFRQQGINVTTLKGFLIGI